MNRSVFVIIPVIVVAAISAYAISPYFTESTIDEAIPTIKNSETKSTAQGNSELDAMNDAITMTFAGSFVGVGDGIHDAKGDAFTIPLEDGTNILRLENFESTNGPDLYVYLSADKTATDFVSLGELKANKGNQNYPIPQGVDLQKYNKVLIWCKAFGVLFGSAEINLQQ